jgi:hypothetical protein
MRWILGFVLLFLGSLAVLATPVQLEGPILLLLSPTHGLTMTDLLGSMVLIPGWLLWGNSLWRRRDQLDAAIGGSPRPSVLAGFLGGLACGLLVAGIRPSFQWLAVGVVVFGAAAAVITLVRKPEPSERR